MATQVQWRGGSTAEHATFTGAAREVTVDTQKQTLVVHDGSTVGGEALLREDGSNAALSLGSAGTPSLKFTGDTNTGIYSPGADQVAVATNGARRLLIDSAGALTLDTGDATIYGIRVGRGAGAFDNNTVVGNSALLVNTSGQNNTAIGITALRFNTTGYQNTAVGGQALYTNTTGAFNTAYGINVLYRNESGDRNVAIGVSALVDNTTGSYNTCVGNNAGSALTTGSNNTIIGNILGTAGLADTVIIGAGSAERLRIDSSGRLLVGTSTARSNVNSGAPITQIETASESTSTGLSIINSSTVGFSSRLALGLSKGSSVGSTTLVSNGNSLGYLSWVGADGTNFIESGRIETKVDGTPGANDMPGRLVFSTTADGASSPTERMRITSDAYVRLAAGTGGIQFNGDTAAANALDDYEEGTFTLTMAGSSTAGTVTYGTRKGEYTKIGNLVTARFYIDWSDFTGTGDMRFGGLPFTASNDQNAGACVTSGVDLPAGTVNLTAFAFNLQSYAIIVASTDNGASANVQCDAQGTFFGCLTYNI
jgi:hypothetical protein